MRSQQHRLHNRPRKKIMVGRRPYYYDDDGDTVLMDGDDEGITSSEAEARQRDRKQQRTCSVLILLVTFFVSLIFATFKYYARPNVVYPEDDGQWDIWGNGLRAEQNRVRLNETLTYLIDNNISDGELLVSINDTEALSPQYMAAMWIATIDQARLAIPTSENAQSTAYPFLQRYSLVVFFIATGGLDYWLYTTFFMSGMHECNWWDLFSVEGAPPDVGFVFGVVCDQEPDGMQDSGAWEKARVVTHLILPPSNGLRGTLPQELHQLRYMKGLQIQMQPGITGTIPSQYGSFKYLSKLVLSYNSLEGGMDFASTLTSLEQLNLEHNHLSGDSIEGGLDFIMQLTNLTNLSLEYNPNITGTIPSFISNLVNLEILALSNNGMHGQLPLAMKDLHSLHSLLLDDNQFSGSVDVLQSLTNLTYVYLEDNRFNDTIDDKFFWNQTSLRHLDLSNNTFRGDIRSIGHLFNLSNLQVLDLSSNQLTGSLPSLNVAIDSNLEHLSLHSNNITGQIPNLNALRNLTHLDLSLNQFTGELPSSIGQLEKLNYLFAGRNNLTGGLIPSWLQNLTDLSELSLKRSSLSGTIPEWLGDMTNLYFLDLGENELISTLPESFGNLTKLWVLILNKNKLNGTTGVLNPLLDLETLLIDDNTFSGDADAICARSDTIKFFVADCASDAGIEAEIDCECCTLCCRDENTTCNDQEWLGNHEGIWENSYSRWQWDFGAAGTVSPMIDERI